MLKRILVGDDSATFRDAIRFSLENQTGRTKRSLPFPPWLENSPAWVEQWPPLREGRWA
jgi:hypothetical protein